MGCTIYFGSSKFFCILKWLYIMPLLLQFSKQIILDKFLMSVIFLCHPVNAIAPDNEFAVCHKRCLPFLDNYLGSSWIRKKPNFKLDTKALCHCFYTFFACFYNNWVEKYDGHFRKNEAKTNCRCKSCFRSIWRI